MPFFGSFRTNSIISSPNFAVLSSKSYFLGFPLFCILLELRQLGELVIKNLSDLLNTAYVKKFLRRNVIIFSGQNFINLADGDFKRNILPFAASLILGQKKQYIPLKITISEVNE